jgi:hypothetical protein
VLAEAGRGRRGGAGRGGGANGGGVGEAAAGVGTSWREEAGRRRSGGWIRRR